MNWFTRIDECLSPDSNTLHSRRQTICLSLYSTCQMHSLNQSGDELVWCSIHVYIFPKCFNLLSVSIAPLSLDLSCYCFCDGWRMRTDNCMQFLYALIRTQLIRIHRAIHRSRRCVCRATPPNTTDAVNRFKLVPREYNLMWKIYSSDNLITTETHHKSQIHPTDSCPSRMHWQLLLRAVRLYMPLNCCKYDAV